MKSAIIDLGTNTFHLLIVEKQGDEIITHFTTSIPAKIGKGGISHGIIAEEGIQRALKVLRGFREEIDSQGVLLENVFAMGTSAIRNAANQAEFIERVFDETGIKITVISGDEEAELIYFGVKESMKIEKPSLIMDIGGGSVEFIICNNEKIFWKQSFEIGGQRLMDKFMKTDPISYRSIQQMDDYFREVLLPLSNACHQYSPTTIIGSSGSFDTLIDMFFMKTTHQLPPKNQVSFELPLAEFYDSYEKLITRNHEERMNIAGMIELRVDMIVVAVCLIRYIIQNFQILEIKVSSFALKEGVASKILRKN